MSVEPEPRAGAGPEPVPGPATATVCKPKRPTPDQSWRAHHRERRAAWASAPAPKFDYVAAMVAANRERDQRLREAKATARAAERARAAEAARAALPVVQTGLRPPAGRLWAVDEAAHLLVGPVGAIGITPAAARVLAPLAVGGRHDEAAIAAAGGCRDVADLRAQLAGIAGRLAAVGLRVDRRSTGIRVAKLSRPSA